MTVTSTPSKVIYKGNGETSAFPIPFYFSDNSHIRVVLTENDRDTEITTGYSITGSTLTMSTAPLSGQKLTLFRWLPITQGVQLTNQGSYHPAVVEGALDEGAMIDQQLQEQIDRSVLVPISYEGNSNDLAVELLDASARAVDAAERAEAAALDAFAIEDAARRVAADASTANLASVSAHDAARTAESSASAAIAARGQAELLASVAVSSAEKATAVAAGVARLADFLKVLDYGEITDTTPGPESGTVFDFGELNHA